MDIKVMRKVRKFAIKHARKDEFSIHGVDHWDRVANYGLGISPPEADLDVVLCFAYLHDVERQNEGYDEEHGPRAAALIDQIRDSVLTFLNDGQIRLLKEACALHTKCHKTGNPTIDACFDSDRLDLSRVGITPDPNKMATKKGIEKARAFNDYRKIGLGCKEEHSNR